MWVGKSLIYLKWQRLKRKKNRDLPHKHGTVIDADLKSSTQIPSGCLNTTCSDTLLHGVSKDSAGHIMGKDLIITEHMLFILLGLKIFMSWSCQVVRYPCRLLHSAGWHFSQLPHNKQHRAHPPSSWEVGGFANFLGHVMGIQGRQKSPFLRRRMAGPHFWAYQPVKHKENMWIFISLTRFNQLASGTWGVVLKTVSGIAQHSTEKIAIVG